MVATSDQFLERAKSTVRAAHQRLAAGRKDNAILEGVVADAARSMYQAINAFFPAVTGDSEGSKIEVRFEKEVVQQGLISRDVFRLFVDGQDSRARIAYRFDLTFTEHSAQEALSRAEAFLKAVEKAIVEHGTVTEVKKTEGVCGGEACIRNTRIPVWTLVQLQKLGRSETQLLSDFPLLTKADLEAAAAYYKANPNEIDALIDGQEHEE